MRMVLERALQFVMSELRSTITCSRWSGRSLQGSPRHDVLTTTCDVYPQQLDLMLERIAPAQHECNKTRTIHQDRQYVRLVLQGNLAYEIVQPDRLAGRQLRFSGELNPNTPPRYCENPVPDSTLQYASTSHPILLVTIASKHRINGQWRNTPVTLPMPQKDQDRMRREVLNCVENV